MYGESNDSKKVLCVLGGSCSYNSTSLRRRIDRRSTPIRLQFDRATTIQRPALP